MRHYTIFPTDVLYFGGPPRYVNGCSSTVYESKLVSGCYHVVPCVGFDRLHNDQAYLQVKKILNRRSVFLGDFKRHTAEERKHITSLVERKGDRNRKEASQCACILKKQIISQAITYAPICCPLTYFPKGQYDI